MLDRLSAVIARFSTGRVLLRLIDRLDRHHALLAASAMAFDAFLSLIPLAAFIGWAMFRLHTRNDLLAPIVGPIAQAAPRAVVDLVGPEFLRLSDAKAAALAPLSLLVFMWVLSGGLSTAMYVFEAIFGSAESTWYQRRVVALIYVIGSAIVIALLGGVALTLVTVSGSATGPAIALVLSTLVIIGLVYVFFRISIEPRPTRRLLPGAIVTVLLWSITSALFSFYVSRLSRYATLYGNLATVAVFLFWLWLLSLALLIGGEINAELEGVAADEAREGARLSSRRSMMP